MCVRHFAVRRLVVLGAGCKKSPATGRSAYGYGTAGGRTLCINKCLDGLFLGLCKFDGLVHDVARLVDYLEVFAHVEQVAGDESLQLCLEVR